MRISQVATATFIIIALTMPSLTILNEKKARIVEKCTERLLLVFKEFNKHDGDIKKELNGNILSIQSAILDFQIYMHSQKNKIVESKHCAD